MVPVNGASWCCDTIPVWVKGKTIMISALPKKWKDDGVNEEDIMNGIVHLIWTGGEPTLPANAKGSR